MKCHIVEAASVLCITAATSMSVFAQETFSFLGVQSDGVFGSPANSVEVRSSSGGYLIGRIDLSGVLTSLHPNSWPSDSRIYITAPSGRSVDVQPFEQGGSFVSVSFSETILFEIGSDPVGDWTFRFYESFDDGGPGEPDASWSLIVQIKVEPIQPPAAIDIGVLGFPSTTVVSGPLAAGEVVWLRFTLDRPVMAGLNTFLDIDTEGSSGSVPPGGTLPEEVDTEIALYDASGNLIAEDDDSGSQFLSQLSFGAGTRQAPQNGMPYDGRDGPLDAGVYYLAAAGHPTTFGSQGWEVRSIGREIERLDVNVHTGSEGSCYADCDQSGALDIFDFLCFQNSFVSGEPYACDCDPDPVCNIFDFLCFQNAFVAGCP